MNVEQWNEPVENWDILKCHQNKWTSKESDYKNFIKGIHDVVIPLFISKHTIKIHSTVVSLYIPK